MLHIKLKCGHFLVKSPRELNYELPDGKKPIYCPTCQKVIQMVSAGSIRKEIVRDIIDASELTELNIQQPHLNRQQCLYILQRRRPKVVEVPKVDNYDIFQDRVKSLLERWERFRDSHSDMKDIDKICVTNALSEIDDEYSRSLGKEVK